MNLVRRFSSAAVKYPDGYQCIRNWTPRLIWDYHAYSEKSFYASTDASELKPTRESYNAYLLWSPNGQLMKTGVGNATNVPGSWHAEALGAEFCLRNLKSFDERIMKNLILFSDCEQLVKDVTQREVDDLKPDKRKLVASIKSLLEENQMKWVKRDYISSTDFLSKAAKLNSATDFCVAYHQILLEKGHRRRHCRKTARILTPPPPNYREQLMTQQKRLVDLSRNAFGHVSFYEQDLVFEINKRFGDFSLIQTEKDFRDCLEDSEEAIKFLTKYFLDTKPKILHKGFRASA